MNAKSSKNETCYQEKKSFEENRLDKLIQFLQDNLIPDSIKEHEAYNEACCNLDEKAIKSFLVHGYKWKCELVREMDKTDSTDPKDLMDIKWSNIHCNSINVKDNSGQIYKAFERDSFSVDLLKKIKKSFNEEKLKKATIFIDKVNDDGNGSTGAEEPLQIAPDFWDNLKHSLADKFIPTDLNCPDSIDSIIVTILALAICGTKTSISTPPYCHYYEPRAKTTKLMLDILKNNSIVIGGNKSVGKTTFVTHSLPRDANHTFIYVPYNRWCNELLFSLDKEFWDDLNLNYISDTSAPYYLKNIKSCNAYLTSECLLIIDDVPEENVQSVINQLKSYTGKYIIIANSVITDTMCNINYINLQPLSIKNWFNISQKRIGSNVLDSKNKELLLQIYNEVNGELLIFEIMQSSIIYLQQTNHSDEITDFLKEFIMTIKETPSTLEEHSSTIDNHLSKYRINTIESSQTTFWGHIRNAYKWVNKLLNDDEKQVLHLLILTRQVAFFPFELQQLFRITSAPLSILEKIGFICYDNNNFIHLNMNPYIIENMNLFDSKEVIERRFETAIYYIEQQLKFFSYDYSSIPPGRNMYIFEFTYEGFISEINKVKKIKNGIAHKLKKLLSDYINIGLYFSYNCGNLRVAEKLLGYQFSENNEHMISFDKYKNNNYSNIIALYKHDIEWIINPQKDWYSSNIMMQALNEFTMYSTSEQNMFMWILKSDFERNLFLYISKAGILHASAISCIEPLKLLLSFIIDENVKKHYEIIINSLLKYISSSNKLKITDDLCHQIYSTIINQTKCAFVPTVRCFAFWEICSFIENCNTRNELLKSYYDILNQGICELEFYLSNTQYNSINDLSYLEITLMSLRNLLQPNNKTALYNDINLWHNYILQMGISSKVAYNYMVKIRELYLSQH